MEIETIEPNDINKHPKIIKEAQNELGNLDILVCGQCHMVFHFVEQFQDHRLLGNCSGVSSIRENNINESKAQVWAFLLWKGAQKLEDSENSWVVYQRWCKMEPHVKEAWVAAGRNVQVFTKLSAAKMQEVRAKAQIKPKVTDEDPLEEGEIRRTNVKHVKYNMSTDEEFSEDPLAESEEPTDMDSELDTEEEAEKEELRKMKNAQKNNGTTGKADGSDVKDLTKKTNSTITASLVKKPQAVPVPIEKISKLAKRTDKINNTEKECTVDKILAKRFNPRKKLNEYLIKWDGLPHEQNTWEPPIHLDKHLLEVFERNLARQKEAKAQAQAALLKQQQKAKQQAAGPSGIIPSIGGGRPQRTSKKKALDQVKQWCGNISDRDDELGLKRKGDSDYSDDDPDEKKMKMELDSGSEDEWQADEAEIERHTTVGRPKILQKSTSVINGIAKKQMTANEVARSIGLASPDRPNSPPVLLTNTKGVVKVLKNQMPNLASGVYILSKKDGVVKFESSPNLVATSGTNIVRVQKTTSGITAAAVGQPGKSIIRVAPKIGQTQIRVIPKTVSSDGNTLRLSPGMSRQGTALVPKIKTTIKPVVRVTSTGGGGGGGGAKLQAQRMQIGTPQLKVVHRTPGRTPLKQIHAIRQQNPFLENPDDPNKDTESSDDDFDPFPKDLPPPEPDSPPREFTLDPMTGLILGQAEGEPEPQPIAETSIAHSQSEQQKVVHIKEEVNNDELTTTQTQDMPSLILTDSGLDVSNVATTLSETTTTITLPETEGPLMITGEDGIVYQVAGQNEEGQTLLVAQGADGQQRCLYVTTAEDGQASVDGTTVLTLDSAVAEAMGETEAAVAAAAATEGVVTEIEPLTVNTTIEEQCEVADDGNSQVVAQLVKAELPSPGGTRKVVLLLPDGNFLMTEVDAEQYASLELDK